MGVGLWLVPVLPVVVVRAKSKKHKEQRGQLKAGAPGYIYRQANSSAARSEVASTTSKGLFSRTWQPKTSRYLKCI